MPTNIILIRSVSILIISIIITTIVITVKAICLRKTELNLELAKLLVKTTKITVFCDPPFPTPARKQQETQVQQVQGRTQPTHQQKAETQKPRMAVNSHRSLSCHVRMSNLGTAQP